MLSGSELKGRPGPWVGVAGMGVPAETAQDNHSLQVSCRP